MPAPSRPRPHRSGTITTASLACVLLVLLSACTNRTDEAASADGLQPGDPAPHVGFQTLSGERLALQELSGPVLVNFWATDCHSCVEETPMLSALWEQLRSEGYHFVAVAMPYDRPDSVVEMVRANAWQHPVAIDIEGIALDAFGNVPGTPTSFLFAADGTLDARLVGVVDGAALEQRVRELLEDHTA